MAIQQDERAIYNFREYIKIQSDHPNPDYDGCIKYLQRLASEIGLESKAIQLTDRNPALILTWEGEDPSLPSILLNSHMDVVPVVRDEWKYDPFSAHVDEDGNIYGRGTQDMKCVTIAQLEAIRRLKNSGVRLKRTIHLTILPDEEIGSANGMEKFVETEAFKNLNIGFDLDEGGVNAEATRGLIFTNERFRWAMNIHCPAAYGTKSHQNEDTPGDKLRKVIDKFMDVREKEAFKFTNLGYELGDVTTINMTTLDGGDENNVERPEFIVGFDVRHAVGTNHEEFEKWVNDVCQSAGNGVYPEYIIKETSVETTCNVDNPFCKVLDNVLTELGLEGVKLNCFGATDARFARKAGIPALGFLPFFNVPTLLHAANEHISTKEFLRGIYHYEKIIVALADYLE